MKVIKRSGRVVDVKFDSITKRIKDQSKGLSIDIDSEEITRIVVEGMYDKMPTVEVDDLVAETLAAKTTYHHDYSKLAAKIAITSLHKETPSTFSEAVEILHEVKMLSNDFATFVKKHSKLLDSKIKHERDFQYDFFGYKTLERAYLLKAHNKIIERPQYMLMRCALQVSKQDINFALKVYERLSSGEYTHATPTLFNSGMPRPQLSSCFLIANKGDSLEGLMDTCKDVAIISSLAGGIGIHIHDVRGEGSYISGSGGTAKGILPLLKTYNELARWWDQGGNKRKGSFAMYLEPWHCDIDVLLDIRKNHGKEELRARDLFTALWIPDLFMQKVEKNEDWHLFCPNEVFKETGKSLSDVYGTEFEELYEECIELGIARKRVSAQDLWTKILVSQIETGTPYMAYKDSVNRKSNQKNIGIIKSSNLCIEIMEYSSKDEQAVCNLASIAVNKFVINRNYDYEKLHEVAYDVAISLDNVIDVNYYPTPETRKSNLLHRPIGIGIQGLADTFALMKIPFTSDEAKEVNKKIFETIYHAALSASCDKAKESGPYESFDGSPASQGLLQYDLWGVTPTNLWDWDSLKKEIKSYGLRNSLTGALMPTASTSQILGNNECFEAFNSNMYLRRTLSGEFVVVNKYLITDLIKHNLWNESVRKAIIRDNGSIQNIPVIPDDLKQLYKTAYEISQKDLIDMAADRAPFIDQSQSMNVFMENVTLSKLTSMHFYGWKKGLKTGMYYLRTKAAADAIKFTLEEGDSSEESRNNSEFECIGCGA